MNIFKMRTEFTLAWDELSSNVKSIVISISAFMLATVLLSIAKSFYPTTDFSQVEIVVVTAFSGFLISFVKENIKI